MIRTGNTTAEEDETIADAKRFGFDAADIADLRDALVTSPSGPFSGVWPENAETVTAFLVCSSQWRAVFNLRDGHPSTRWIGLDYAGAKIALDVLELEVSPGLWAGLMTMEHAACAALNGD